MDITLEKIDLIRERTGVSYREAKEALERNEGNVIDTLIELEDKTKTGTNWTEEFSVRSTEVIDKVKELIREGNVNKIRIKHEGRVLAELPVALGAIGAVVLPQLAALGVLVAVFKRCTIEVVREEPEQASPEDMDESSQGKL
jgi:Transcription factor homologous to NACalpha-BTF3